MANIQGEQNKKELSPELLAVMEEMRKQQMEFVKELRKPTEEELEKQEAKKAQAERKKKEEIEMAKAEMASKEMRRRSCTHSRQLGQEKRHSWRGQVTSGDGLAKPVCTQCQTEFPPFRPQLIASDDELRSSGINLEARPITVELLTTLHKQTYPNKCPKTGCWVCYPELNDPRKAFK